MPSSLPIAAALALLAFGANMAGPLYPGYQERLGFGDLTLTLVYATYAVVSVPALLVLGPLGDRWGRVRLMRIGLVLAAAGALCFAIGDHPGWLFAGRILQGTALGAATGAGMALLAEASAARPGRRVVGGAVAFLAGTAAGPGLTGLLADHLPEPHATVHLLYVAALLVVRRRLAQTPAVDQVAEGPPAERLVTEGLVTEGLVTEGLAAEDQGAEDRGARGPVAGRRPAHPRGPRLPVQGRSSFLSAAMVGFLSWAVVGLFLGLVPSAVARGAGEVGTTALGAVAALVLLAALPAQALLPRLGAMRAERAGLVLLAAALAVLAATGAAAPLPVVLATAVVAGVGHGLAYGGAHAVVESTATGAGAAGTTALAYVVYYLGAGLPTVAVGLLATGMPLPTATGALAAALLAVTVVTTLVTGHAQARATGRIRPVDCPAVHDTAAMVRGALRGLHEANGILHGVQTRVAR
ncbi:MFS transporter [Pseudonocardia parietis]|uniref:MFS family permease n=1 Tax=Pseudonocardia parietis TaxID=570936 RepID=A0ABS4VVH1_9PSEU|nr:MFS transporter [Pseudonocardia parietis]MBP2367923.1 MFS family permease [Pseudonocardia parietis]